jgi:hypothetical protein
MGDLSVTLEKLRKYCKANGGYDLDVGAAEVTLTFAPNFPEAEEKRDPDESVPRITMKGRIKGGRVYFEKVEIESSTGVTEKNLEDARLTYEGWLGFIEDNY